MGRGQGQDFGATGVARRDAGTSIPTRQIAEWTAWIGDVATLYEASGDHESYDELDADARALCKRLGFEPEGGDTLYAELSEWASRATLGTPFAEAPGADYADELEDSGITLSDSCEYLVHLDLDGGTKLVVAVDPDEEPVQAFLHSGFVTEELLGRGIPGTAFSRLEDFLTTTGAIGWALRKH